MCSAPRRRASSCPSTLLQRPSGKAGVKKTKRIKGEVRIYESVVGRFLLRPRKTKSLLEGLVVALVRSVGSIEQKVRREQRAPCPQNLLLRLSWLFLVFTHLTWLVDTLS